MKYSSTWKKLQKTYRGVHRMLLRRDVVSFSDNINLDEEKRSQLWCELSFLFCQAIKHFVLQSPCFNTQYYRLISSWRFSIKNGSKIDLSCGECPPKERTCSIFSTYYYTVPIKGPFRDLHSLTPFEIYTYLVHVPVEAFK